MLYYWWEIPLRRETEMASVVNEYDTKIDSKKRFTLRGAQYDYYHVYEYEDGHIELTPRILVHPEEPPPDAPYTIV